MDIEKLQKLSALKEKGILTQEEFDTQKQKVLEDNSQEKTEDTKKNSNTLSVIIVAVIMVCAYSYSEEEDKYSQKDYNQASNSAVISPRTQKNTVNDDIKKIDEQVDAFKAKVEQMKNESKQSNPDGLDQEKNQKEASLYDNILSEYDNIIENISVMPVNDKVLAYRTAVIDMLKQGKQQAALFQKGLNTKFYTYTNINQFLKDKEAVQYMKELSANKNELIKISFHKDEIKNEIQGKAPFYKTKITKDYFLNNSRQDETEKQFLEKFDNLPKEIEVAGHYVSNVGIALIGYEVYMSLYQGNYMPRVKPLGEFITISLRIKNEQNDAIVVNATSFKLVDKQNHIFSHSVDGMTALMLNKGNQGFLTTLNPLMETDVDIVFDVPKDIDLDNLVIRGTGGFMGDTTELPLKIMRTGN